MKQSLPFAINRAFLIASLLLAPIVTSSAVAQTEENKPSPYDSQFSVEGFLWNKGVVSGFKSEPVEDQRSDDLSNHAQFRLGVVDESPLVKLKASFDVNHFAHKKDGDWEEFWDPRLQELYFSSRGENVVLTLGNQVVRWGKADEISPLDIVTPEDMRDGFVRPRTERKFAVPMVNMELTHEQHKFQALYLPVFKKSRVRYDDTAWSLFGNRTGRSDTIEVDRQDGPSGLSSGEFGFRAATTVSETDLALSFFHGRSDLPMVGAPSIPAGIPLPDLSSSNLTDLADFSLATGQPIVLRHPTQNTIGLEFETVAGSFGIRGDIAYRMDDIYLTKDLRNVEKPVFIYVLGADYSSVDGFYGNLQFSQQIVTDYDSSILYTDEITNLVFGRLSQEVLQNNAKLDARLFYDFTTSSYYFNPRVFVTPWDNPHIEIGADILGGPSDQPIGYYRNTDQIYCILKVYL